jgi:hypothetical protein
MKNGESMKDILAFFILQTRRGERKLVKRKKKKGIKRMRKGMKDRKKESKKERKGGSSLNPPPLQSPLVGLVT